LLKKLILSPFKLHHNYFQVTPKFHLLSLIRYDHKLFHHFISSPIQGLINPNIIFFIFSWNFLLVSFHATLFHLSYFTSSHYLNLHYLFIPPFFGRTSHYITMGFKLNFFCWNSHHSLLVTMVNQFTLAQPINRSVITNFIGVPNGRTNSWLIWSTNSNSS
jgi:hypothetical protein